MNPDTLIFVATVASVAAAITALITLKQAKDKAERELTLTKNVEPIQTSSSNSVQIYSDWRNRKGTLVTASPSTSTSK